METAPAHLVVAPVLIPLLVGALMLFFEDRELRFKFALSLVAGVGLLIVALLLLWRVHFNDEVNALVYLIGNWPVPVAINLVADRLAVIMLLLTASLALPCILFAFQRWEKAGPHFYSLFQFLLVGLNGAFLTGDLFNLFVFFEVMLAASYGLVLHGGGQQRIRAGLHYIAVNLGASLIFLAGIAMVFGAVGSLNLAEIALRANSLKGFALPLLHVGLVMIGIVFLVKAGTWPLGFWLVPAYSSAAGPTAAIFTVLSKVGIYSLLRLALLLPGEGAAFGSVLIFIGGVATLIFSCLGVLASQSMKRATAYFIFMSSGTLLTAFGISSPASTAGALFYLFSSTLAIGAFFLLVELLERDQDSASDVLAVTLEAYGLGESEDEEIPEEEEEEETGASDREMPGALAVLGFGFGVLTLILIGLPPLSGFLAKFAIMTAILGPEANEFGDGSGMRITLAALLVISGVVALIALSRMGIRTFWAPVEPFNPRVTVIETAPILLLVATLVVLAVAAGPVMDLMLATAGDLHDPGRYVNAVLDTQRVPPFEGRAD